MTTPTHSTFQAEQTQENNMAEIIWEDPAPATRGIGSRSQHEPILEALKANPGKWAVVVRNHPINGLAAWLKKRGFEATVRSAGRGYEHGRADIYARYIGDVNA